MEPVSAAGQTADVDELTLARARRGEAAALASLLEKHAESVHALVSRMLVGRGRAIIEELCQESLVKVIRGLPSFDSTGPARLSTWILSLTARSCIDWLRSERRRGRIAPAVEATSAVATQAGPPDPERMAIGRELRRRVEAAMSELPDEQRVVLVLRAYHDLDYDEIALALGIEVGTVKSRLGRARLTLRRLVAVEGEA